MPLVKYERHFLFIKIDKRDKLLFNLYLGIKMRAKSFYLKEIEIMKERGTDGFFLGCTELPIILKDMKAELPLLSTTNLHTKMAVDFILS